MTLLLLMFLKKVKNIKFCRELIKDKRKKMYDIWLEPDLGDMNPYTFKKMAFAYQRGYFTGVEYAPKIKKLRKG